MTEADTKKKRERVSRGPPGTLPSLGLACTSALIAVNFTHPIEVVKTRMQMGEFSLATMLRTEGMGAFWKGISSGWLREASYTTVKLGGYAPIRNALGANQDAPFAIKFLAGSLSGSIGSVIGNPFDVMKTMMMTNADGRLRLGAQMKQMLRDAGMRGFYRGVQANVMRACVLNGTKMACYDTIKGIVVRYTGWTRKDLRCQFLSAIGAGFFMTCTVSPFDMLRTRLMNQPTDRKLYKGFSDAFLKILRKEGPFAFWRGFLPIWGRFAPQALLMLVIFEKLLQFAGFDPI